MKEFIDKLIEEEKIKVTSLEIIVTGTKEKPYFEIKYREVGKEDYDIGYSSYDLNNVFTWKDECFEIVNELAEEYKDKVMIDGQYCWQTCSATEHCKECNRLCNGSIDYYENYDFMAEEYNKDCCEWKQYDENDIYYTGCEQIHMFIDGSPTDNKYEYCPYCGKKIKVAPYTEGEAELYRAKSVDGDYQEYKGDWK